MWITIGVIIVIMAIAYLVLNYYPPLGGKASPESIRRMEESPNRSKGKFLNEIPTDMSMSLRESGKVLIDFVKGNPEGKPKSPIPIVRLTAEQLQSDGRHAKATWFGHSAVLVQIDGKTIFIDPMLGNTPSPVPVFGGKRYSRQLPIEIDDLPAIDAVILSHDHYDHLDYGTIRKLKNKVKRFFVPLGVAGHLKKWGVEPGKITEHGWWEELEFEGLKLATAPARHFSGRSLGDRNSSLWCSWVIIGEQAKIFFSGDSGYGPHFEQIGEKYGPFDLTFMECGQYDKRWSAIHMLPEETVQAHLDVKGNVLIPIHWGAFTLALHDWTDPIERASKAAKELNVALATPRIGEVVSVGAPDRPSDAWWRSAINRS